MQPIIPHLSCDCHTHVFGSVAQYPYALARQYTSAEAGVDALRALGNRIGTSRDVIVQPSPYGADNRCTVDALAPAIRDLHMPVVVNHFCRAKAPIAANPNRMLWGSDWPQPAAKLCQIRYPSRIEPFNDVDDASSGTFNCATLAMMRGIVRRIHKLGELRVDASAYRSKN